MIKMIILVMTKTTMMLMMPHGGVGVDDDVNDVDDGMEDDDDANDDMDDDDANVGVDVDGEKIGGVLNRVPAEFEVIVTKTF